MTLKALANLRQAPSADFLARAPRKPAGSGVMARLRHFFQPPIAPGISGVPQWTRLDSRGLCRAHLFHYRTDQGLSGGANFAPHTYVLAGLNNSRRFCTASWMADCGLHRNLCPPS